MDFMPSNDDSLLFDAGASIRSMNNHCMEPSSRWQRSKGRMLSRGSRAMNLHEYLALSFGEPNLPSGKRLHNYGKSPALNGKINYFDWAILNSKLLVYPLLTHY